MKRRASAVVGIVVVGLGLLAGCSSGGASADADYVETGAGRITIVDPADRKPAPTLEGEDLAGEPLSTADWEGDVIVLNVWGPWCPPCRKEMPVLKKVSEEYADQGVQFAGILNKSSSSNAAAYNKKLGITYPSFADQGGRLELQFNDSLPTVAIPTTWIIDPQGRVAARIAVDDLTESTLSGLIDDVKVS